MSKGAGRFVGVLVAGLGLGVGLGAPAGAEEVLARLLVPRNDIPPHVTTSIGDETRPGLALELVEGALRDCGVAPMRDIGPLRRQLARFRAGELDVIPFVSFNDDRARIMAYPGGADGRVDKALRTTVLSYSFFVPTRGDAAFDGRTLSGIEGAVRFLNGSSIVRILDRLGIASEPAPPGNTEWANLAMVAAGRSPAYVSLTSATDAWLARNKDLPIRKLETPIVAREYYTTFHDAFFAKHREKAACAWARIAERRDAFFTDNIARYIELM